MSHRKDYMNEMKNIDICCERRCEKRCGREERRKRRERERTILLIVF
jgi:hypothetical protein